MSIVVDASVASKWFFREQGSDEADKLLNADGFLIAPDLIVAEVVSVVWRRLMAGEVPLEHATLAVSETAGMLDELTPMAQLASRSLEIARALRHPASDCFYVALAEQLSTHLVTADEILLRRTAKTPWARHVRRLGYRVARA
jgi:predicted nucleic acid-binding protein